MKKSKSSTPTKEDIVLKAAGEYLREIGLNATALRIDRVSYPIVIGRKIHCDLIIKFAVGGSIRSI